MKNIYIYCEGQTEESFINRILAPYFWNMNIYLRPIICTTGRKGGRKYKGGATNYEKIRSELLKICKSHPSELVTTMFDFYGMPENTPGIRNSERTLYERIEAAEKAINADINKGNFRFHFMVHEFESLLFSKPEVFEKVAGKEAANLLMEATEQFPNPEHINNSLATAPSKRILKVFPGYTKVRQGTLLAEEIGIDQMMEKCPHFKRWIEEIKAW